jgi:beta-1,2-mannobiose phosphorylase / 1,2-beta-oligomannan phosphorylase
MSGLKLQRLGQIMEPESANAMEVEGVLNPAAVRGPDGKLYLFPRLVAKGNYSRIGIARVLFNDAGDPFGVERLGIALEPQTEYELRSDGSGGCEDARVTFVEPLQRYLMSYTALSQKARGSHLQYLRICFTGRDWDWQSLSPTTVSILFALTIRTPVSSL